jgi:hypothetical protein
VIESLFTLVKSGPIKVKEKKSKILKKISKCFETYWSIPSEGTDLQIEISEAKESPRNLPTNAEKDFKSLIYKKNPSVVQRQKSKRWCPKFKTKGTRYLQKEE